MLFIYTKKIICFSLLILFITPTLVTQNDKKDVTELAEKYISLYTQMKFDEMSSYYSESSVFEDPTTSFFHPQKLYEVKIGPDAIVSYLKNGFKEVSNIDYKIDKQYTVGIIHFVYGTLNYKYALSVDDGKMKQMDFYLPLAIILTIKNNKVVHHQDIADYNVWNKQYKDQLKYKD